MNIDVCSLPAVNKEKPPHPQLTLMRTSSIVPVSKTYRMSCDHLISIALSWRPKYGL